MTLLCAGESFDDLVFSGLERLPRPGEEVRTDRFTSTIGGGAVITAVRGGTFRQCLAAGNAAGAASTRSAGGL